MAFRYKTSAIVLAAGKGVRMESEMAKVLHEVGGRPMVAWVCSAASAAGCHPVIAVVGHQREEVEAALPAGVKSAHQAEQLGTGHAVMCAREVLDDLEGYSVILCGDVPLISPGTIREAVKLADAEGAACVVVTMVADGEHAYGRIVRDDGGEVVKIVEHRDASEEERKISEVNSGTYCFRTGDLFAALDDLKSDNAQGEYYLTDVIALLKEGGRKVLALEADDTRELAGVDSLEALERVGGYAGEGLGGSGK